MKIALYACLLWSFFSASAYAAAVEVFLLSEQDGQIENLNTARDAGHPISYHVLDAEVVIETALTAEVANPLAWAFEKVTDDLSKAEIAALGEEGITAAVMALLATDDAFKQQAQVMQSVANDPDTKDALLKAQSDKDLAAKRGITLDDLPAIFFDRQAYKQVTDFHDVLQ